MISWIVSAFIILMASVLYLIISYNQLVSLRNRVKEAWSDIEVQLKRRHDLIPNLVETVKGYASHEKGLFEKVSAARSAAISATSVGEKAQAENQLSGTLKTLFAVSEAYPDLKASSNFLELQKELRDTEDKIQASRRFYNANVRDMNTRVESFPTSIIASMFNFEKEAFFDMEEEEKETPEVKF